MGKLRLNPDHLAVDSFDTATSATTKGTVFGEQQTAFVTCNYYSECAGDSCGYTCGYTCDDSCGGSCWYTDCGGNTADAYTCNPSNDPMAHCCPV